MPKFPILDAIAPWLIAASLLVAFWAVCIGCSPAPSPNPVPVPGASCEAAEDHLRELGCVEEGLPLWEGFAETCIDDAADGIDDHPDCVAGISSCDEVEAATRGGCHGI